MHSHTSSVLTTVLLKFSKATILLPVTKKTLLSELKTSFLEALNSTKSRPEFMIDQSENGFEFFRRQIESNSSKWILLSDLHLSLSDIGLKEAEILGVGFLGSDGSCPDPEIEAWREPEDEETH
ncbi:hypothetical protein CROQUDRAFT_654122 [Cronartium quercuum f. sp. fusiforme G11]|uniref:Uncharacterized protein n=1 Tax=Cronartium quercuum f. sp. fusiforme G11 TaxID=708437 RepID=A0A9P6NNZ2_9BASI|nr:hypothetical protein CROQUDRAFT_654122 [Cronartium quercuum f. sp. fusiforme G11]